MLLKVSAKTQKALGNYVTNIASYLETSEADVDDVVYTLNTGRSDYSNRIAVSADNKEELIAKLYHQAERIRTQDKAFTIEKESPAIILLFSSHEPSEDTISHLREYYPAFARGYDEVVSAADKDEKGLVSLAAQYGWYSHFALSGIKPKTVIGTGVGRLTKKIITDGLSVKEAVSLLSDDAEELALPVNAEKLKKAVESLIKTGPVHFIEAGAEGVLSDTIRRLQIQENNVRISTAWSGSDKPDPQTILVSLYEEGQTLDWKGLYTDRERNKVEAPTYPFDDIRCWPAVVSQTSVLPPSDQNALFHNLSWIKDQDTSNGAFKETGNVYLVIMDADGLGQMLADRLVAQGNTCVKVYFANGFSQVAENHYEINAEDEDDYIRLHHTVIQKFSVVHGIIHLGNFGQLTDPVSMKTGLYSQFFVTRAFHEQLGRNFRLCLITSGAVKIEEDEQPVIPQRAVSDAFVKGIMAEYPLLKVHCIDGDASESHEKIATSVLTEFASDPSIRFAAYRNGQRFIQKLNPVPALQPQTNTVLERGLVTGGASGIGYEIAKYLVDNGCSSLVIIGQTHLPDEEDWKNHDLPERQKERIERLNFLKSKGADLLYLQADLNKEDEVKKAFTRIETFTDKLDLVVHSAGVSGNWEPTYRKKFSDFKETLGPKVSGTAILDKCTARFNPETLITFSSLNAVVPQKYSVDYAVANAFQNAYAESNSGGKTRYLSISWPGWYETGMSVERTKGNDQSQSGPLPPLSNEQGIRAFEQAIRFNTANVFVANISYKLLHNNPYFATEDPAQSEKDVQLTETSGTDTASDLFEGSPTEVIVHSIWKEVLKADVITLEDDFFDLGGHSLNGAQVINRIEKEFGLQLDIDDLYDCTSLSELAQLIDDQVGDGKESGFEEITAIPAADYYEVSYAQRRLWILNQMREGQTNYNLSNAYIFEGLDVPAFEKAFYALIDRHESLRTTFITVNDLPYQVVRDAAHSGIRLEHIDVSTHDDPERRGKEIVAEGVQTVFDLEKGPLVAGRLIHVDEKRYVFMYVMHHIVSDGWSMQLLQKELLQLYRAFSLGLDSPLSPLSIQYKDYAAWQNRHLSEKALTGHEAYWLNKFSGTIPVLNLPADFPRPAEKSYEGAILGIRLDDTIIEGLNALSRKKNVSLFMMLQAILKTLFYRYTGMEDIVLGTVEAGRNHHSLEDQIGYYINTLALRSTFSGHNTFDELLSIVKKDTLEAFEHKIYPFDLLVDKLRVERNLSHAPLFDVSLVLQNIDLEDNSEADLDFLKVKNQEIEIAVSKFDINLVFLTAGEGMFLQMEYSTELFSEATMRRLASHFEGVAKAVLADQTKALSRLDYMSDEEINEAYYTYNDTRHDLPDMPLMHRLFEQTSADFPDHTALLIEDVALTYREVNQQANKLARYLRESYALEPDSIVAINTTRSERMIIGLLGILKAGAAYLPIDANLPDDRISFILDDAGVNVLLTDSDLMFDFPFFSGDLVALDIQLPGLETDNSNPDYDVRPEHLAYVIYTSGSTGRPKGVMIEHRSNVNMSSDQARRFGLSTADRVLQFASLSFDASVYEIFMSFYSGASLVLCPDEIITDGHRFTKYLKHHQVSVVTLPPAYLASLDEGALDFVRVIITAGEAANPTDAIRYSNKCTYVNAYGPTEAAVCVANHFVSLKDKNRLNIPIGMPLQNTGMYILDQYDQPVPVGVEGEIVLSGINLARGYLNNQELTERVFVHHPVLKERVYKTGDTGRRLTWGEIVFTGRNDDQLKVRGYRIEPAEINSFLLNLKGVGQAIVLPKGEGDARYLQAYVAPEPEAKPDLFAALKEHNSATDKIAGEIPGAEEFIDSLEQACKGGLPSYMVPDAFTLLAELPVTVNGKVDRKKLASYDIADHHKEIVLPDSPTEKALAEIWKDILGLKEVSIHDSFFDLGGQSLKATQLLSRIARDLDTRLELGTIFNHTTIAGLATYIDQNTSSREAFAAIQKADQSEHYPLSHAQERLWILDQFRENKLAYLIPAVYRLSGKINTGAFASAFDSLVERYEILRTTFELVDGEPRQFIRSATEAAIHLDVSDMRTSENQQEELDTLIREYAETLLDLAKGPLVRAGLVRIKDEEYILLLTIHHIITDGWSVEILTNELSHLYNDFANGEDASLKPLRLQFKDFAVWQHSSEQKIAMDRHRDFWMEHFSEEPPALQLPADFKRPLVKTYNGAVKTSDLTISHTTALRKVAAECDSTLFMVLLSSVNALLHRYANQKEFVVGTTVAGRMHKDLEDQVGFFVNTLALNSTLTENDDFISLVGRVRQTTLEAFEHQAYSFDKLVDELALDRDPGRSPLFDVMVELVNVDIHQEKAGNINGLSLEPYRSDYIISKYDYSFRFAEKDNTIKLYLEYNQDIYSEQTVSQLLRHYQNLLEVLLEKPYKSVWLADYLSSEDKKRLVSEYNNNQAVYPQAGETLSGLFEKQARKTPEAIALYDRDARISYARLDEMSNQVANYLIATQEVKPGDLVGIRMSRTHQMVAVIFGILKAGAAYVPIEINTPEERAIYILKDTHVKCLFTEATDDFSVDCCPVISAEQLQEIATCPATPVSSAVTWDALAYVMFTSGSTGNPKGVAVPHKGLVNRQLFVTSQYDLSAEDIFLLKASYAFDVSASELFMPLSIGAGLVLSSDEAIVDPQLMLRQIKHYEVTVLHFVPSMLHAFLHGIDPEDELPSCLRYIFSAGEELGIETVRRHYRLFPDTRLYNCYGPTETCVDMTQILTSPDDEFLTIGTPIPNTTCYILDEYRELVPERVVGEIAIGGQCLADGYLNQPELTEEKFIYKDFNGNEPERIYLSGDLGAMLPGGQIVFRGRKDKQIKLRGQRIELGEIESELLRQPGISRAAVRLKEDRYGEKVLAAYYTSTGQSGEADIKNSLIRRLPAYMVPAYYIKLADLPYTKNGKLNEKLLPDIGELEADGPADNYIAPDSETEKLLVNIMEEVLGKRPIGIRDNFFRIGGNSLKAARFFNQVNRHIEGALQMSDLFVYDNIESLATHIDQRQTKSELSAPGATDDSDVKAFKKISI
ncbi:MAG: amino acid adenylation domain-containing protein [Cyclobacteriaceae bacterium]